ncbi:hypothetical protein F5I97DRAFT_889449 [Phlebopus sp. FC_14]|nr:hypothetical protein F5I97DRAFT_889449 [Phlebopus sp. FC_14]
MAPTDLNSSGFHYLLETQNRQLALSSSVSHSFISPFITSIVDSGDRPNSSLPSTIANDHSLSKPSTTFEELPLVSSHRFTGKDYFAPFTPTSEQDAQRFNKTKPIPRPPNAFMLYRSDFLRRRTVPPEVEHRQQNLSRIAGQCWNLLSEEEKDVWHNEAAAVRAAHYAKYPFYKFRPNRKIADKDAIGLEPKASRPGNGDNHDAVRPLREEPKEAVGTFVGPIRRTRTARPRSRASPYVEGMFAVLHTPLPPSFTASTSASSSSSVCTSPSLSPLPLLPLLPSFTLQEHFSYPTPGTSQSVMNGGDNILGLEPQSTGSLLTDGTESISDLIRGLDITTAAAAACHENNVGWKYEDKFASGTAYLGLEQLQLPYSCMLNYPSSAHCDSSLATPGDDHLSYYRGIHAAQLAIGQPRINPDPSVPRGLGCDEHCPAWKSLSELGQTPSEERHERPEHE